ncbi:MAG: hypothetical protein ABW046_01025, partial [Actinoplanes sp.]
MMIRALAFVARWRLPVLLGTLVLAVVLGVAGQTDVTWLPASLIAFSLAMLLIIVGAVTTLRYRPAGLVRAGSPPEFQVPPHPFAVFTAAAFTLLGGMLIAQNIGDIVEDGTWWPLSAAMALLWVLLLAFQWRTALGDFGLRLRPDGIVNRQVIGSQSVPWEAFATEYPALPDGRNRLALRLARPDLVQRRGALMPGPGTLMTAGDPGYLSWLIHQYVADPERRAAIGTEAELSRLDAAARQ